MRGRYRAKKETLAQIQEMLLGGPMKFTREEVARDAGVPLESVRVLWRSMGYADVGDESVAFTDEDVNALHRMLNLIQVGQLDSDTATDLVRGLGQTTARLADWQINSLAGLLERSGMIEPADGLAASTLEVFADEVEKLMPDLGAAGLRVAQGDRHRGDTGCGRGRGLTVRLGVPPAHRGFRGHGRLHAAVPTVARGGTRQTGAGFEAVSADIVAAADGRLVKSVGDEVLFVASTAEQAAEIAVDLHAIHAEDDSVPEMRIGLATGQVVSTWVTCSAPR